jgi:hypothetical protein
MFELSHSKEGWFAMAGIDDPIEATKKQYPEESPSPLAVMIDVLEPWHPFAGMVAVFRQFTSHAKTSARVKALFEAFEWYIRRHEAKLEELTLEKQLELPAAKDAVIAAVTESIFTPDVDKIKRFGAILGYNFMGKKGRVHWERAAAYIRALSQLGDDDIKVLRILHDLQRGSFIGAEQKPDLAAIPRTMERALINAEKEGISREDTYSRCARLNGFGLTLQMERPRGMASAVDYVYRLTRQGKQLMDILHGLE